MRNFLLGIIIGVVSYSCATSQPPERDFTVDIWVPDIIEGTLSTMEDDDTITTIEMDSLIFSSLICMHPLDYKEERKYQALLVKSCEEWR